MSTERKLNTLTILKVITGWLLPIPVHYQLALDLSCMNNVYHTDGYCSKNGSKNSIGGFTVFKNGKLFKTSQLNKMGVTSNECELEGLAFAIEAAEDKSEVVTDSNVVFFWTRSGNPKARPDLKPLAQKCKDTIKSKALEVYWAPREENQAGIYNEERFNL